MLQPILPTTPSRHPGGLLHQVPQRPTPVVPSSGASLEPTGTRQSQTAVLLAAGLAAWRVARSSPRQARSKRAARTVRIGRQSQDESSLQVSQDSRRSLLLGALLPGAVATCPQAAVAGEEKLRNLAPEKLAEIIEKDVSERAFMVTADLTRAVYDESCTFTDEIDTYQIDKFIKGTQALFLGPPYSRLSLTSPVTATDTDLKFTFSEDLVFNIPFKPVMSLTGRMVMTRGPDGLITKYREYWDGGVVGVLKTVRLSGF